MTLLELSPNGGVGSNLMNMIVSILVAVFFGLCKVSASVLLPRPELPGPGKTRLRRWRTVMASMRRRPANRRATIATCN